MMNSTATWLPAAIADLAAIDNAGMLSEMRTAFAADCRAAGGMARNEERAEYVATFTRPDAAWQAHAIARVAAEMFGVPTAECERVACDVLVGDPWREIALRVIAEYRARITGKPEHPAVAGHVGDGQPPRARRRAW